MKKFKARFLNNRGTAAVEFAILLPIWLMIFFGLLDYSWYLTNVMVMENAVSSGARAGVKVKYWLDPDENDPFQVAKDAVKHAFWLDDAKKDDTRAGGGQGEDGQELEVEVKLKDVDNKELSNGAAVNEWKYLEVKVVGYKYTPLTGYLPEAMMPSKISAVSLMAFP
ncbi:MAG: pilus assembly protein [Desulfobacteraceae bacterium]|nr:pilus assembly protein [Desulfobacteraceae bacterium]